MKYGQLIKSLQNSDKFDTECKIGCTANLGAKYEQFIILRTK